MYLPVTGTNIHLAAAKVTRGDFETFVRATGYDATEGALSLGPNGWTAKGASWVSPSFPQTASHPVVGMNIYDALEFCRWLTARERAEGKIGPQLAYRLPTDEEWSKAAGRGLFTWGDAWPPPVGAGNFAGQERKSIAKSTQLLADYNDGFVGTSPVRTYQPNSAGFYDLSGNALDLCATWFRYEINPQELRAESDRKEENTVVVLRGSSWMSYNRGNLRLELRDCTLPQARYVTIGFRCVLGPVAGAPHLDLPPPPPAQNAPPLSALEGMDVVDRRLVAIWEYKPGNSPEGALRWEQEASGRYKLARGGEVVEAGTSIAREGRLQQQPDGSAGKSISTYRLKTSTQLVTDGPMGEISWRRIRALSTEQKEPIAKEDTGDGSRRDNTSPQNTKPRSDDSPSRPKPRPQPSLERKARDIGNSIRRRLPF
jgi:formylglycine-generating enzyme required for sulfatase activity